MKKTSLVILVAAALVPPSACASSGSQECTLIACESGLDVTFQSSAWPAGDYVVTVVVGTETRTCSVTLPFAAIDPGAACSADLQLNTSGSALPPSEHRLLGVQLSDTPATVTITITRDAATLATQTFTPSYTTSRPNGPNCDPECTQASATLSF